MAGYDACRFCRGRGVDDPVLAVPVHMFCGIWGLIAAVSMPTAPRSLQVLPARLPAACLRTSARV